MAKKSKIRCEVKTPGDKKVMVQLDTVAEGFGRMKCDLQYSLDTDGMTAVVMARAEEFQKTIDGIEVDPTDEESVAEYAMACMGQLTKLFEDIKTELAK